MLDPKEFFEEEQPLSPLEAERLRAVAVRYEKAVGTPTVVAKGTGLVAENIIQKAEEAGVFVHTSRELVSLLMQVDLDARIPPELYKAVAEVLAWVYEQDAKAQIEPENQ